MQLQSSGSQNMVLGPEIAAAAPGLWLETQIHYPRVNQKFWGKA